MNAVGEPTNTMGVSLGDERLLSIADISNITGLSEVIASRLMKETGKAIRLHRRLHLLQSSFLS